MSVSILSRFDVPSDSRCQATRWYPDPVEPSCPARIQWQGVLTKSREAVARIIVTPAARAPRRDDAQPA